MNTTRKSISRGDRIYARLSMHGRTITEFMINTASSMTDVLSEIRYHCRKLRGLCTLFIRNHSRGWSEERPLMLYTGITATPASAAQAYSASASGLFSSRPASRMQMPWETH